jgi:nitrogen regulatory protein PII
MKMVIAIIQPYRLDPVREALNAAGFHGMTVTDVRGYGRQKGHTEIYRGAEYEITYLPKVKIEVVTDDERVEEALDAIIGAARTGKIGDGKMFVVDVVSAMRIRTGESGSAAL